ncbi:hypothetical protein HLV37_04440 [Eggerthellaceae bacterium zg-1084]|uniref:Uncharacterized protein n=1 Tax=Berryella wangjianweii TaxID=2734634 RepID=A0A6M8J747_9ACTN|nr:hypothetical protein [Berryella wangjianweii]NPD31110.1 hypothetical protein [Berryella wangjianweii]QKF07438.1 hypothetical protein HLV38_04370 [Berryella wangjianweii]
MPQGTLFCSECGTALPSQPVALNDTDGAAAAPEPAPEAPTAATSAADAPAPSGPASFGPPPVDSDNQPFYGKTPVVILALIFFPLIGIILMWLKSCRWAKGAKIAVSVVYGILTVAWIAFVIFAFSFALSVGSTSSSGLNSSYGSNAGDSSSAIESPSNGSQNNAGADGKDAPIDRARLTASNGQISAYALAKLNGEQLVRLAEERGLTYDAELGGWTADNGLSLTVLNPNNSLDAIPADKLRGMSRSELDRCILMSGELRNNGKLESMTKAQLDDLLQTDLTEELPSGEEDTRSFLIKQPSDIAGHIAMVGIDDEGSLIVAVFK